MRNTERFKRDFPADTNPLSSAVPASPSRLYAQFLAQGAAASYGNGLIRFHTALLPTLLESWEYVSEQRATPELKNRLFPFATTWHGDVFSFDQGTQRTEPIVVLLETGTGELLHAADDFDDLLGLFTGEQKEALLVNDFYLSWIGKTREVPPVTKCVGYRQPLFLGGKDELDNLEISDLDVYVHLFGQLYSQSRATGTAIGEVGIS